MTNVLGLNHIRFFYKRNYLLAPRSSLGRQPAHPSTRSVPFSLSHGRELGSSVGDLADLVLDKKSFINYKVPSCNEYC
jgi:hypothetical protein